MSDYSSKENSLWIKFEAAFVFVDLKVILLIVMLFNFYKETVLYADIVNPNARQQVRQLLYETWHDAGAGYWKWIVFAVIGDIAVKKMLKAFNE